jgi:hypothetical protein
MCLSGVLLLRLGNGRINVAWPAVGGLGTGVMCVDDIMHVKSGMIIQCHLVALRQGARVAAVAVRPLSS